MMNDVFDDGTAIKTGFYDALRTSYADCSLSQVIYYGNCWTSF